ncbi:MAG TPA: sialidase family protein [Chloroflexia bacterium]|nr:sialidase family protein [Chloroflexia bacterium]
MQHIRTNIFARRSTNICILTVLLVGLLMALVPLKAVQAAGYPQLQWSDSGLNLTNPYSICVDTLNPYRLLAAEGTSEKREGVFAYNWKSGQKTQINSLTFDLCGENGLLYTRLSPSQQDGGFRFSMGSNQSQAIAHFPTNLGHDGTTQVYSFQPAAGPGLSHLWASSDGGLTWQERGQQFEGQMRSFSVAQTNARAVYALVQARNTAPNTLTKFTVYFSPDAGINWEKRFEGEANNDYSRGGVAVELGNPEGQIIQTTPVGVVNLTYLSGGFGSSARAEYYVSTDGAHSFSKVGFFDIVNSMVLRYTGNNSFLRYTYSSGDAKLEYSTDGAKTWQASNFPGTLTGSGNYPRYIMAVPDMPTHIIMAAGNIIWHSPDSGRSWEQLVSYLADSTVFITPYSPLSLLAIKDNHLYYLDLPDYAKAAAAPAQADSYNPSNNFYSATGHNMGGVFKNYWEKYGGLSLFGYPRTEAFHEVNPSDGKIYVVQYFERNRFEYHPDLAGTRYEVLLGLLGNQLTEQRRAAGEGAFNHFADMHYPGGIYFSQTGHNLRNTFKEYWEKNGGLAIYGYPISEEFYEVNPDDGKTYVVQYFERNRFEWHPENKGTPYEVLLGLLGNSLLKQKGWL